MTKTIFTNIPRRQHPTSEAAERAIEVFYPAGWFYQIVPIHMASGGTTIASDHFAVKVYDDNGFLGYAYNAEEEQAQGGVCVC